MNTYDHEYTDDEADLADMPPPVRSFLALLEDTNSNAELLFSQMLHDSGSERSPSIPPETIRTPHSVSFRVTDEPFIYIKDALHPSMIPQHDNCSSSSFFAASASLYASQHDSSKITAQTFFDTPTDHSSGIGSRKRSPHLYIRRGDEVKRRRVTPDVSKRTFMPPRSMRRPTSQNVA